MVELANRRWRTVRARATLAVSGRSPGEETHYCNIRRHGLVKIVLGPVQAERHRVGVSIREESSAAQIPQVLLMLKKIGAPGVNRTPGPGFRKPLLYPTELRGHANNNSYLWIGISSERAPP
jgi:hypothetical protein